MNSLSLWIISRLHCIDIIAEPANVVEIEEIFFSLLLNYSTETVSLNIYDCNEKKNLKPIGQKKTVREIFFWYLMIRQIFFISRKEKVLGSFPKAFSNVKWKFPKWQLPKSAISQAATSQMYIFPNDNFPSGSCLLGKCPWEVASWENALGKLPLGKRPLGKYLISKKTYVSKMLFILIIDDPLLQRLQCPIYVYNGTHIIA